MLVTTVFSTLSKRGISITATSNTLLKKIKGSDVLDLDCTIIFSEQDHANQFLLISSFSLKTVKFQNRQNNLFFTKDVWAIFLSIPFFRHAAHVSKGSKVSLFHLVLLFHYRPGKIMSKRLGKNKLFNKRISKTNFLIFFFLTYGLSAFKTKQTRKLSHHFV